MQATSIPLSKLVVSTLNVRKTLDAGQVEGHMLSAREIERAQAAIEFRCGRDDPLPRRAQCRRPGSGRRR